MLCSGYVMEGYSSCVDFLVNKVILDIHIFSSGMEFCILE